MYLKKNQGLLGLESQVRTLDLFSKMMNDMSSISLIKKKTSAQAHGLASVDCHSSH
jgi:hypothetical protein